MNRFQAFGIHFGISFLIFLVLAYLIWFVWYPDFFFDSDGGWQGMRIVIAVDLVMGPVLTLVVYKQGKPGLTFDLSMIALLQAVCLAAGVWIIFSERPLAIVYVDGSFYSMSADAYDDAGLELPEWADYPGPSPKWIRIDMPTDPVAQAPVRQKALQSGRPLRLTIPRYLPFSADDQFLDESYDIAELQQRAGENGAIGAWLDEHGGALEDYRFYPFAARYTYVFLGFDGTSNEPLGLLHVPAPLALAYPQPAGSNNQ